MNGLDTCFFQGQFKTEIEFGRIDTDENVRPLRKQMIPEMVVDTLDFTIVRQNLEQAVDGKLFHRPVADEIVFRHLWATDAVHQCIGQLGTKRRQQVGSQQIAGRFTCYHGYRSQNPTPYL